MNSAQEAIILNRFTIKLCNEYKHYEQHCSIAVREYKMLKRIFCFIYVNVITEQIHYFIFHVLR